VVLVGLVWTLDFIAGLAPGKSPAGVTAYMFSDELPLALRATSTYHIWLPVFVLWLCRRQGYDDRGAWLQCIIGTLAIVGWTLALIGPLASATAYLLVSRWLWSSEVFDFVAMAFALAMGVSGLRLAGRATLVGSAVYICAGAFLLFWYSLVFVCSAFLDCL
jgi:hypothetical protein